jgi:hypothetical protein
MRKNVLLIFLGIFIVLAAVDGVSAYKSGWSRRMPLNISSDDFVLLWNDSYIEKNVTNLTLANNECWELRIYNDTDHEQEYYVIDDGGKNVGDGSDWCIISMIGNSTFPYNSSAIYHVYYDAPSAPDPAYNFVVFGDDFSTNRDSEYGNYDGSWGVWTYVSGKYMSQLRTGTGGGFIAQRWFDTNTTPICDMTITLDAYKNNADGDTDGMGAAMIDSGGSPYYGYASEISAKDDKDKIKENRTIVNNETAITRDAYVWYELKFIKNGNNLHSYVNETEYLYNDSSTYGCLYPGFQGYVGGAYSVGDANYFDNFCVVNDDEKVCYVHNTSLTTQLLSEETTDSALAMTSSEGWTISEGTQTTISCTGDYTETIVRDGVSVSNPYTFTPAYGSYNFTCNASDGVPHTVTQFLTVSSGGFGCTDNDTFAFQKTFTVDGDWVNLNFTDLVASKHVKVDLSDVYVSTANVSVYKNDTYDDSLVVKVENVSSIQVSFGNYYANYAYANASNTTNTSAVSGYTEINPYYMFNFYNEVNGTNMLVNTENTTLKMFCADGSTNMDVDQIRFLIATTSQLDDIKSTVTYSASSSYYRNYKVRSSVENKKIYLVDATEETLVLINIRLQDLTGDFDNSTLMAKKYIEGSLETMTELDFDAENKALMYLINGDKYQLFVDNGYEERVIGYLYVDTTDTDKTLVVGPINVSDITPGNISLNLTFGSISLKWYDPASKTNSVSIWIYNITDDSLFYSSTSTNRSTIEFVYAVPDENATYKVRYQIDHETLGIYGGTFFISGDGAKTIPPNFPIVQLISGLGGNTSLWLSFLFVIPFALAFSFRNAGIGAMVFLGIVAVLAYWDIFQVNTSIVLTIGGLIAVLSLADWIRRNKR